MITKLSKVAFWVGVLFVTAAFLPLHADTKKDFNLYMLTKNIVLLNAQGLPVDFPDWGNIVGERFFAEREVYQAIVTPGDPPTAIPTGTVLGQNLVECVIVPPAGALLLLCQGSISFDGRGFVSGSPGPVEVLAPQNKAVISGGTDDFLSTTGEFTATQLPNFDQLYEVHLRKPFKGPPLF